MAGIGLLLVLVIKVRLEPFVSLLLVSAGVALAAGIPLSKIVPDMEAGMGKVLAHVAPIVGLGAMLGKMLELSGGAERIADRLLGLFGQSRAPVALGVTGLIFGVPVFFDVGVIVLAPVVYAAALRGRRSMLYYGMPRPNAPSPGAASTGSFSRRPTSRPGGSPPATSTGARIGGKLVPVGATEFAQDATFGYSSSNLRVRRARAAAYNAVPSRHG